MPKRKPDEALPEQPKRLATSSTPEGCYPPTNAGKATFDACVQQFECLDYQNAITIATSGMTDMFESMLALLNLRAVAYGKTKQFDKGLKDANQLISYAPFKAAGYLIAGKLYSLQSQYKEAMKIYEQGLQTVPKNDQGALQQRYANAKAKANRRIDFIARLPYDLVCHVLDNLSTTVLLQTLQVSRIWRDRIASYSKAWTSVYLHNLVCGPAEMAVLPSISRHIESLEVHRFSNVECDNLLLEIMNGNYRKLKRFIFTSCQLHNYGRWMITLWHVKDTLTDLCISMNRTSPLVPLGVILSTCTNLTNLRCAQYNVTPTAEALGSMPIKPINSLTDLNIEFSKIESKELEMILRCCPKLRHLMIKQCDSDAIGLVRRLCPNLEAFGFNLTPPGLRHVNKAAPATSQNGIRYLSLLQYTSQSAIEPTGLLRDCAPVVEHVVLGLPLDTAIDAEDILAQWNPIATITYRNLKTLSLAYHRRYGGLVSRLLSQCPNLVDLMFADCSIDRETCQSILLLRNLRKLTIEAVNNIDYIGLTEMLAGFSIPGAPAIQAIDISDCQFKVTDGILQPLAVIPSLRNIHFSDLVFESQGTFERFARALRDGPSTVTNIILSGLPCVTDKALEYINGISSLRSIELYGLDSVTPLGLQCLYSNSRISALIDT